MDYDTPWEDAPFVEGGALGTYSMNTDDMGHLNTTHEDHHNYTSSYRYRDMLNSAFNKYKDLKGNTARKDASVNIATIAAIGLVMLGINNFITRLLVLVVTVILCFEVEIQIPAASLILAVFFYRDCNTNIAKSILIVLSLIVMIYYYWSHLLDGYTNVIWWVNIIIVVIWAWLIFRSSSTITPDYLDMYGGQKVMREDNAIQMLSNEFDQLSNDDYDY